MRTLLVALIVLLGTFQAYAISVAGWERPIKESVMRAQSSFGLYETTQEAKVFMTKRDRSSHATGIQLHLDSGQEMFFSISKVEIAPCGTQKFIAEKAVAHLIGDNEIEEVEAGTRAVLVDHSLNTCSGEPQGPAWQVQVFDYSESLDESLGELVLTGEPFPVYTIQSQGSAQDF